MDCVKRKRMLTSWVLFFLPGIVVCSLYPMTISARLNNSWLMTKIIEDFWEVSVKEVAQTGSQEVEKLLNASRSKSSNLTECPPSNPTDVLFSSVTPSAPPLGNGPHNNGDYLEDLFFLEGHRRGLVTLHIIGMIYVFISFLIVCDQFFVPALLVIKDQLSVSDDVAGATFMAAGRSLPKLFALLIGVFVARINVGIGTIVGPAVFNFLFVIGTCALFSREVLRLSRWPLFRDMSFYLLDLMFLVISFLDNVIMWWESMMLVTSYTLYVMFMKFDVRIQRAVKGRFHKCTMKEPDTQAAPTGQDGSEDCEAAESSKDESDNNDSTRTENETERKGDEEQNDMPLSLKWPNTLFKQVTYLFLLPVILPLWLTLPDVRNQKSRKYFAVTFLGSILWNAVFSFFLVWCAHQVAATFAISAPIMTILAATISSPELITSVIVARKGLADMTVSSCVGSSIFDITVGLPLPWLLYSLIHVFAPVAVSASGLFCAVLILFVVLVFVVICFASCKCILYKVLGLTMILLYFVFFALSMMLKFSIIVCPV